MSGATAKASSESSPAADTAEVRQKLRQKWELASVLNFLHVFEPVMKTKLKLSAEDIETALIEFNDSFVQLHIALLKGITSSKLPDGSEAWVTILCRELELWWPWVAQGNFPLSTTKGEELSRYKELDPTVRLLILKAVCEQDDIASFINESIKGDTAISAFRKEKLADEKGTAYWYDGDEIIGHRLYREVHQFKKKIKFKGKEAVSDIYFQWETIATNPEELHRVMDEFSSSRLKSEVSLSKTMEVDVIPDLEKLEKKKQRALKKLEKQNAVPSAFQSSRLTRSSRSLKPISYTYDEYDRAIKEAIKVGTYSADDRSRKLVEKPRRGTQTTDSTEGPHEIFDSPHGSSSKSDLDIDGRIQGNDVDDISDDEYANKKEDTKDEDKEVSDFDEQNDNLSTRGQIGCPIHVPKGSPFKNRIARTDVHGAPESLNMNAKNRSRQRPSVNTAFECSVPDTKEELLSNGNSFECSVPGPKEENLSNGSSKRL